MCPYGRAAGLPRECWPVSREVLADRRPAGAGWRPRSREAGSKGGACRPRQRTRTQGWGRPRKGLTAPQTGPRWQSFSRPDLDRDRLRHTVYVSPLPPRTTSAPVRATARRI